jgi:hypothetical protein
VLSSFLFAEPPVTKLALAAFVLLVLAVVWKARRR